MPEDSERERVAGVYAGYAQDAAKQRAWSAENPGNRAIRAELVAALAPLIPTSGDVLDAGCGAGWWLAELAARGVAPERLHGVELLDARAHDARERVPGAQIAVGDVRELPLRDASVGLLTLLTVLSSMASDEHRRAALREARRVLARGGAIAIWEPRVPTGNASTARVTRALLHDALDGLQLSTRTLTLVPPLARRVSPRAYRVLAALPPLRTHRLLVARA